MATAAEASSTRIGTVRPPAHLAEMPAPSRWRRFHAETLAMHVHGEELVRRFGAEAVARAMSTTDARQIWLNVEGFRLVTERAPATVRSVLTEAKIVEPHETGVIVVPESAYESGLSPLKRSMLRDAVGSTLPPDSKDDLEQHAPTPPRIEGDERTVVAGALMIEAAASDDYTSASAAEVLFTDYADVLGITAAAVGVRVEQPVWP